MPVYSHSRLSLFEDCPLQYKFNYIDKIQRYEEGIEAFVGSRFHETMEKLYTDLRFKICTLDELLDYYDAQWLKEYTDEVKITRKDRTLDDYKNLGRKCIEAYYKRNHPFNQTRTLGLEKAITIDLNGDGKYQIRGFIDRLAEGEDGTYEIHDYKTVGHLPVQSELDSDRQLALYHIGIRGLFKDVQQVKLIWHFVVFDKEMSSERTPEQLESLKASVIEVIDRIENTKEFLPRESSLCNWCSYQDLCPVKKHVKKVEALPVNEYLNDDGVKLVNQYQQFALTKKEHQQEIDKIEAEQEKIKQAIIAYGQKEGVEVIKGSGYKAKISEKTKYHFPPKGSLERQEMERILKESKIWDAVVGVDNFAVQRAIEEGSITAEIISELKKYVTMELERNVSFSKDQLTF